MCVGDGCVGGQRQQAARVARLNAAVRAAREDAFGRGPALSAVVRRTRFRTRWGVSERCRRLSASRPGGVNLTPLRTVQKRRLTSIRRQNVTSMRRHGGNPPTRKVRLASICPGVTSIRRHEKYGWRRFAPGWRQSADTESAVDVNLPRDGVNLPTRKVLLASICPGLKSIRRHEKFGWRQSADSRRRQADVMTPI